MIITEYASGSVYYDEYHPQSGAIIGVAGRRLPDNTSQYAFSGDTAYYVKRIERLGRPTESQLIRYNLMSGEKGGPRSFNVQSSGYILAWDGLAYYATIPFENSPILVVYALQSLEAQGWEMLAQGQVNGFDQYAGWSFQNPVISDGYIYWLGIIDGGRSAQVEIWRYNLENSTGQFELFRSFEAPLAGVSSVPLFDVDGSYFAAFIESGGARDLLLFNSDTDNTQVINIDISPYGLALLHLDE